MVLRFSHVASSVSFYEEFINMTTFHFRSELDASSGIAATLQQLAASSQWQFVVAENVSGCLERLNSRPKVSAAIHCKLPGQYW